MPLYTIDFGQQITDLPAKRKAFFYAHKEKLTPEENQKIHLAISAVFDTQKEFNTSHIPGRDWDKGPFAPVRKVCNGDDVEAGWLFGLLFWEIAIKRDDDWRFYKTDSDAGVITGTFYIPGSK